MFDWDGFESGLLDALLTASAIGRPLRAVALAELYAETDGIIAAPCLGLNTNGEDIDSPPDWEIFLDDWAPESWIEALTAEACSGTVEHWENTFARYLDVLVRICVAAGARLGVPTFIEHPCHEELLERCLTQTQLRELFPQVVAAQAERARVSALPIDEQIAYHVSLLNCFDGLITNEEAQKVLRGLGSAAIPALLPLLRHRDHAHVAAKLLAEIGVPDDGALAALSAAVSVSTADSPAQLWSCRALAQLDRLDMVLAEASRLSPDALATAVAARYTAFRDYGVHPLSLDYRPLDDFLNRYPQIAGKVAEELAPGSSYCEISAAEVPEAIRGATSPHLVVRTHAVCVLGERRLGEAVGHQVLPLLRSIARSDPDDQVRGLAGLSLQRWRQAT